MLQAALAYVAQGFKVFPVKPDKKPLTEHGLKDATQLQIGVKEYWRKWPDAGIAIPTDGLVVLDFDIKHNGLESKQAIEEKYGDLPATRTHVTGSGGFHYIYRNSNGTNIRNTVELGGYEGVDIRANGGYIVVPPSLHESGGQYELQDDLPIATAPDWLMDLVKKPQATAANTNADQPIPEGQRHDSLIRLAGTMRRPGMTEGAIFAALLVENNTRCQPPLPESDIRAMAKTAMTWEPTSNSTRIYEVYSPCNADVDTNRYKTVTDSVTSGGKPLSGRIEDWLKDSTGWCSYDDIDRDLNLKTIAERDNRRQIIKRLKEAGIVEANPKNNKLIRFINTSVRKIDFKAATKRTPLDIKFPFQIEQYFNIYSGNIAVVAGAPDAGKTGWILNFIRLNQDSHAIFYQCSEMYKEELAARLTNFEGIDLDSWTFEAEKRSSNFADVIRPDCINIIDYMELTEDIYKVADYLKAIHEKLESGIAIVALQKKIGAHLGRGAEFSLEKPRLYLSMDAGKTTIIKAKNWVKPDVNPNGLVIKYKIVGGCKFIITEGWHKPE